MSQKQTLKRYDKTETTKSGLRERVDSNLIAKEDLVFLLDSFLKSVKSESRDMQDFWQMVSSEDITPFCEKVYPIILKIPTSKKEKS